MGEPAHDITLLLQAASSGGESERETLMAAVYQDLRRLAAVHLRSERADHTLQPTALVHEAYLKLVNQHSATWNDRRHFFAIASQVIRRILIDHARERAAMKRGGPGERLSIGDHDPADPGKSVDILALDEAMRELAELDERQARVVELRFFGGCSHDEIAALLGVTRRTVDRDWLAARAWLFSRMTEPMDGPDAA